MGRLQDVRVEDSRRALTTERERVAYRVPADGGVCVAVINGAAAGAGCHDSAEIERGATLPSSLYSGCVDETDSGCTGQTLYGVVRGDLTAVEAVLRDGSVITGTIAGGVYAVEVEPTARASLVRFTGPDGSVERKLP